jgi:outer membrane immunogenic protein
MRAVIVLAGLMSLAAIAPAAAADPITIPMGTTPVAIHDYPAGFDWSGFYAGVYGVARNEEGSDTAFGGALTLGANASFQFVLLGAEVSVQGLLADGDSTAYGQLLGRAGFFVTDDVMVYAAAGYGLDLGTPAEDEFLLGAGVEFAVTDDVSLRGQYLRGLPTDGGGASNQFSLGANFHF